VPDPETSLIDPAAVRSPGHRPGLPGAAHSLLGFVVTLLIMVVSVVGLLVALRRLKMF